MRARAARFGSFGGSAFRNARIFSGEKSPSSAAPRPGAIKFRSIVCSCRALLAYDEEFSKVHARGMWNIPRNPGVAPLT
jgi:hypothetical protein